MEQLTALKDKFDSWTNHQKAVAAGGVAVVLIIVVAKLHALFSAPAPVAPAQPVAAQVAATGTPPTSAAAAVAPAPAPTQTPALGSVMLPSQPEPAGLTPRLVQLQIESQQDQDAWSPVANLLQPASIVSVSTQAPNEIVHTVPTDGVLRNTWTFWVHVDQTGQDSITASIEGTAIATANVFIDDGQAPSVTVHLNGGNPFYKATPGTADHAVGLATGWHKVQLAVTHEVHRGLALNATVVLSMLQPGGTNAVAIVPSAVDPAAAARVAAAAAAAASAASAAPSASAPAVASTPASATAAASTPATASAASATLVSAAASAPAAAVAASGVTSKAHAKAPTTK